MRREALQYLACPECAAGLKLHVTAQEQGRIQEGVLSCACGRTFPIIKSVPRLLPDALFVPLVEKKYAALCRKLRTTRQHSPITQEDKEKLQTQAAFGFEWLTYPRLYREYERQFLEWIQPVQQSFFKGKVALDGGCGTGRHVFFAAKYGTKHVLGLDLSDAVDVAAVNTKDLKNVTIVQGDIFHPPFKKKMEYVYSIGVIHHLPSPSRGFASLQNLLVSGGAISTWTYGKEGNALLPFFDFLRKMCFRKLPLPVNRALAWLGCIAVTAAIHGLYKPLGTLFSSTRRLLPQYDFLIYLGRLNFTVRHSIIFDQMLAPTAFYIPRKEVEQWYRDAGLQNTVFTWRNKNSWCGFGLKP